MSRLTAFVAMVSLTFALAACGTTTVTSTVAVTTTLTSPAKAAPPRACDPPPGQGHTGSCAQPLLGLGAPLSLPANAGLICDLYEGSSVPDFTLALTHLNGCVLKAYEVGYREDAQFAARWRALAAAHKWRAAYLFVRAGDCNTIARTYLSIVNSVGGFNQPDVGPPVLDVEVPSAAQDAACLATELEQLTGRQPVIYTAPGTWPGGSHDNALEWAAGYGNYVHSPCIWTCLPVAWQYTDGTFGPFPHSVPGLNAGDLSVDYGFSKLVPAPPPPPPRIHCFGPKYDAKKNGAHCRAIRGKVARWERARAATGRVYVRQCAAHLLSPDCQALLRRYAWFEAQIRKNSY